MRLMLEEASASTLAWLARALWICRFEVGRSFTITRCAAPSLVMAGRVRAGLYSAADTAAAPAMREIPVSAIQRRMEGLSTAADAASAPLTVCIGSQSAGVNAHTFGATEVTKSK